MKIYIDGVEQTLDSDSAKNGVFTGDMGDWTSSDELFLMAEDNNGTARDFTNGRMRDFRLYDYALTAEQAASLYSGSYNVTPFVWYKMDETNGDMEDSGTGGGSNASLVNTAAKERTDITLDLDGALTVAANGTLSAPRGELQHSINTAPNINGTIIHNNGTLLFDRSSGNSSWAMQSGVAQTWYNWTLNAATNSGVYWNSGQADTLTLEGTLTIGSGCTFTIIPGSANRTLVMGTASAAGTIANSGTVDLDCGGSGHIVISGASTLNPAACTGTDWDWDQGSAGAGKIKLSNIDYQITMVTGGGGAEIQLDGDCEFDGVTISRGDTFDINGQHCIFGDNMLLLGTDGDVGTLDFGDNAVVIAKADFKTNDLNANITYGTGSVLIMR